MLTWPDIDTVMFDMDGTLLDLHFDNYFWQTLVPTVYGAQQGISAEQAALSIHRQYADQHGSLNWYCMDYWGRTLNLDIASLKFEHRHRIALRPHALSFLQSLQGLDKQVFLVTNAHPDSLKLKLAHTGIGSYFAHTISSHTLGLAKEHAGFWQSLQNITSFVPERTLLIDDNLAVLQQARREGIAHLRAIRQPDSSQPPLPATEFVQIEDFRHVIPAS
ncbi:MAG: GMP/IMP nucleotidase [Pseudomonadales bacterium]|nr:GMP/IMP nucleotidase [Pseudomonadales bacterium]